MNPHFKIKSKDKNSSARLGKIHTAHGVIETPVFAPVGSQGTIKALTHAQVEELGAQIMLVNAYHLYLRPGLETIRAHEGVHAFMSWKKPILSDSGGFQIYSLSPLAKVKSDGVQFASHLDGTKIFVTPEDVIDIQLTLGTDILMPLDYFVPYPSDNTSAQKSGGIDHSLGAALPGTFPETPKRAAALGDMSGRGGVGSARSEHHRTHRD